MSENHRDIKIPRKLLSKLELKHDVHDLQQVNVRNSFEKVLRQSVPDLQETRIPGQQAHLDYYDRSRVAVTGNVSEVARCRYRFPKYRLGRGGEQQISGSILSSLAQMEDSPFAVRSFEKWISGLGEMYNFNVLDIYHWEQRLGRWFAMVCSQFDLAWKDFMTPYNTRSILIDLLSVDEKYRRPPNYLLYQKLMEALWPRVLSEPINPHVKDGKGPKKYVSSFIHHLRKIAA